MVLILRDRVVHEYLITVTAVDVVVSYRVPYNTVLKYGSGGTTGR